MCFLDYRPDLEDFDDPLEFGPVPRSYPRLAWAVPVDTAELGASLETFEMLSPQIRALRLCHRFANGPLSALPQELLDHIIGLMYLHTRGALVERWNNKFRCFQGRCTSVDHLEMDDEEIQDIWTALFSHGDNACCHRNRHDGDFDPTDYGIEEKREIVEKFINEEGDWAFETIDQAHETAREDWLDILCLCKTRAHQTPALKTFFQYQKASWLRPSLAVSFPLTLIA